MPFHLPDLPFARDALAPHMSAATLDLHHGKHHRAYVDKTNELLEEGKGGSGRLIAVIARAKKDRDKALFNQAAQLWNHAFFWQCLCAPEGQQPAGKLAALIEEGFESTATLLEKLKQEAVGHFASGWAWLVLDRDRLKIVSLHDADTPAAHDGMKPLLTLDLWEHAYYVDYKNEREAYVEAVLANLVNWDFVARNLDGEGVSRADQEP